MVADLWRWRQFVDLVEGVELVERVKHKNVTRARRAQAQPDLKFVPPPAATKPPSTMLDDGTAQLTLSIAGVDLILSGGSLPKALLQQQSDVATVSLENFTGTLTLQPSHGSSAGGSVVTPKTSHVKPQPTRDTQQDESIDEPEPKRRKSEEEEDVDLSPTQTTVTDNDVAEPPARVSLGQSPTLEDVPATLTSTPSPRWGHTVTALADSILVYGGQNDLDTVGDISLYRPAQGCWIQPTNAEGLLRQWHSSTYLPDRQLLLCFGGETVVQNQLQATADLTVLDTDLFLWYPPAVSGPAPSARSGHAAVMYDASSLWIWGGVQGTKWCPANQVYVLHTTTWKWETKSVPGPTARSYHSATALPDRRVVVFGGNNARLSFGNVAVWKDWEWEAIAVGGVGPCPRTGHQAVLLKDQKTIWIYGGWDPNDEAAEVFGDSFFLDTERWCWSPGPTLAPRVGHGAILKPDSDSNEVVVFGGQQPRGKLDGTLEVVSLKLPSTPSS